MAIEAEYYRWGRRNCGWNYLGVEEVVESDGVNHYFSPTILELTAYADNNGPFANIKVKGEESGKVWATLWRDGVGKDISTNSPILLVPGEILTIRDFRKLMNLSFLNEAISERIDHTPTSVHLQQIQE